MSFGLFQNHYTHYDPLDFLLTQHWPLRLRMPVSEKGHGARQRLRYGLTGSPQADGAAGAFYDPLTQ